MRHTQIFCCVCAKVALIFRSFVSSLINTKPAIIS
ncbi:hypothetical protein BOSE21B_150054 [Bosea sp. 21B]|nr:hypothetical protein BOSE21B_150054 [Bosea sp. 21B]CAD5300723.1 hypothetical protein BOSE7B_90082 [Bosea sp. 7B]VXC60388.1 hypothetical protein BOSE127_230054 [Bosea sp. 127]